MKKAAGIVVSIVACELAGIIGALFTTPRHPGLVCRPGKALVQSPELGVRSRLDGPLRLDGPGGLARLRQGLQETRSQEGPDGLRRPAPSEHRSGRSSSSAPINSSERSSSSCSCGR